MADSEPVASLPLALPPAAEAALKACAATWADADTSEAHLRHALAAAPDALAVRMGAYKFYFYRNRLAEAAEQALSCLDYAATALEVPADWRAVAPGAAAFERLEPLPRLYLQCLLAYGYCRLRLGDETEGRAALLQAGRLDPGDRFGALRLLAALDRGGRDEDDD